MDNMGKMDKVKIQLDKDIVNELLSLIDLNTSDDMNEFIILIGEIVEDRIRLKEENKELINNMDVFRNMLLENPEIINVSYSSQIPGNEGVVRVWVFLEYLFVWNLRQ